MVGLIAFGYPAEGQAAVVVVAAAVVAEHVSMRLAEHLTEECEGVADQETTELMVKIRLAALEARLVAVARRAQTETTPVFSWD